MRRVAVAMVVVGIVFAVTAASSPHDWAGKLLCGLQGGEWTNRFRSAHEEIVTAGRTCVK
jgi:hypothetical protein